jgi:hypothetical protein
MQKITYLIMTLFISTACSNEHQKPSELHVFVSHYGGGAKSHYHEVETAIAANLANPEITSVHVLYEPTKGDGCAELKARTYARLARHWSNQSVPGRAFLNGTLGCTETPSSKRATLQEVLAIYPQNIFGEAAKDRHLVVVTVNADIVLDRSVRRLQTLSPGHAAVLSVNTGPEMLDCCFTGFSGLDSVMSKEAVSMSARNVALKNKQPTPAPLRVPCAPPRSGQASGKATCNSLPDRDTDPHTANLRRFYRANRLAKGLEIDPEHWWDTDQCSNSVWRSRKFLVPPTPIKPLIFQLPNVP